MKNITLAILAVMDAVKGIEKDKTVGTGNNAYQGVSDQSVKQIIGTAMAQNGLCIVPTGVKPTTRIDRWTETGGQYGDKQKQSVFTEVETKYLLMHTSGESIELSGYGHGTDPQDKSAGKATTYALKYTLLYMFLVPTGKIDDADNHHSDVTAVPLPRLNPKHPKWQSAIQSLLDGKTTIGAIERNYYMEKPDRELLLSSSV